MTLPKLIAALFISALSAPSHAQVTLATPEVQAAAADPRIAAVITRVRQLDTALVDDDRAGFAAAMAENLAVNNPQNGISRPGDAVARNAAGRISYDSYVRTIEYIGMRGNYVLLMGGEVVTPKGTTAPILRRFTDLWEPTDGGWLLSARQATIVAGP